MGIEQSKPNPKRPSLEDNIIEMKIQCKQLERAGKKAEKEEANYKKKAKEALKKNNEEGAKMFLMTAASKRNEGILESIQLLHASEQLWKWNTCAAR